MQGFFTPKNLATLGGVILSFVVPHLLFSEDQYEIEYVEPEIDDEPTENIDTPANESEDKE